MISAILICPMTQAIFISNPTVTSLYCDVTVFLFYDRTERAEREVRRAPRTKKEKQC